MRILFFFFFRYVNPGVGKRPNCAHGRKKGLLCRTVSSEDVAYFQGLLYESKTRQEQNSFICMYIKTFKTKTSRKKQVHATYHIKKVNKTTVQGFIGALRIGRSRLESLTKEKAQNGKAPRERRGGDRRSHLYADKRKAVKEWIGKLKAVESHYGRGKSVRHYLPSELLSIKNIWRLYTNQAGEGLAVIYQYFKNIFFNRIYLAIGTPRTDVCSTCLQRTGRFKIATTPQRKQELTTQKRIHSLRAKAFYQMIKFSRMTASTLCLIFDCMQNQVLPRIPDQSAFYSRQLYYNVLGVVEGTLDGELQPDNVFSYAWTKDQAAKGSSEIASAVFHRLCNSGLQNKQNIVLVSDGCGGLKTVPSFVWQPTGSHTKPRLWSNKLCFCFLSWDIHSLLQTVDLVFTETR